MKKIKRRKKVFTKYLDNGCLVVMRLLPWMRTEKGCIWLASIATGKSRRQINDWLKRKTKRKRVLRLDSCLTGKHSNVVQVIGIQNLRIWLAELLPGDSITLCCESAKPDKQFRVWKRWFVNHEDPGWDISEEFKSFFFYKKNLIE